MWNTEFVPITLVMSLHGAVFNLFNNQHIMDTHQSKGVSEPARPWTTGRTHQCGLRTTSLPPRQEKAGCQREPLWNDSRIVKRNENCLSCNINSSYVYPAPSFRASLRLAALEPRCSKKRKQHETGVGTETGWEGRGREKERKTSTQAGICHHTLNMRNNC